MSAPKASSPIAREWFTAMDQLAPVIDYLGPVIDIPTNPVIVDQLGFERIDPVGPRLYQPQKDGEPALIIAITDGPRIMDLLAFNPDKPKQWRLRAGRALYLGHTRDIVDPLRVFDSPLDWVRASGDGFLILDWKTALPRLYGLTIEPETVDLGKRIKRDLGTMLGRQMPRIVYRKDRLAA